MIANALVAILLLGHLLGQASWAQDSTPDTLAELTDDQRHALGVINERNVKSAVSFMASDALRGRGTPSRGFDVACAYVASRFRGAGLNSLPEDGSYFQTTTVKTVQTPVTGITFERANGEPAEHFGLLSGGDEAVKYQGPLGVVRGEDEITDQSLEGLEGVVLVTGMDPGADLRAAFRQQNRLGRLANRLAERDVTAMLVSCEAESGLVTLAERSRSPQIESRRMRLPLAVLLVPKSVDYSGEFSINLPKQRVSSSTVQNVVGVLKGSDPERRDEAVIFSAHLDHLGARGQGEDRIYNGADDNASGVTAVLSLADAYGQLETPPARSTIFIAFWGEERGLLGSRYFCDHPLWPLDQVVANINVEMIGRPQAGAAEKCWVTGWEQSNLGPQMALGSQRVGVEIFNHPRYSPMLYRASDNFPFVQRGVIAHSFSAGSLHDDYHQPSDEWPLLNIPHMTRVIQGLFAGSLPIADGKLTPEKQGAGR